MLRIFQNFCFLDLTFFVGEILVKWLYTDNLDNTLEDSCVISLLDASIRYQLDSLKSRLLLIKDFIIKIVFTDAKCY